MAGGVQSASAIGIADTSGRTPAQVRARWAEMRPDFDGSKYADLPKTNAPYDAGQLTSGYLDDAVDTVNFARWLVGLPDDVTLDKTDTLKAQHGAVLLDATGTFTHKPAKPSDMSQAFYDLGYAGTSGSNISWGVGTLAGSVRGYMDDKDPTNIAAVGHRLHVLAPSMDKTGFGESGRLSAMYVFDDNRADAVNYNYFAWPSAGAFPVSFFSDASLLRTLGHIQYERPWSITLNPSKYDVDSANVVVTLTRVSDGRCWTFDRSDRPASGKAWDSEYLNVTGSTIVFRPETSMTYPSGSAFDVRVTGGVYVKGTKKLGDIAYRTTFCKLTLPSASVSKPAVAKSVKRGKKIHLTGTLKPQHAEGLGHVRVYKYRKVGGRWVSKGYSRARLSDLGTDSHYHATMYLRTKGSWRVRACVLADAEHSKTWSKYSYVKVR